MADMRIVTVEPERRAWRPGRTAAQRQAAHLEGLGLLAVALVVLLGGWLAYRQHGPVFADAARGLAAGTIVDINQAASAGELDAAVAPIGSDAGRERAARAAVAFRQRHGAFSHVGALGAVRTDGDEASLFSPGHIAAIKDAAVVRSAAAYRSRIAGTLLLFLAAFAGAHLIRRVTGTTGDPVLLPAAMLLTGLSAMALVSMRDPLRDTIAAAGFVYGVAAGCALLTALAFVDFEDPRLKRATVAPMAAAVILAFALLVFGSGPGGSGAKVNLFGMQPIEAIRLLAVLALASYFSRRWELLREIASPVGPSPAFRRRLTLPRLRDVRPLAVIVGTLLVFFVLQKDLGPALVLGAIALGLYGVARGCCYGRIDGHLLSPCLQRMPNIAERYPLHVRAEVARSDELDVWMIDRDIVAH